MAIQHAAKRLDAEGSALRHEHWQTWTLAHADTQTPCNANPQEDDMSTPKVGLGREVKDFEINTFDPKTGGFGKFSLAEAKEAGKWTVLFFYPADFTFV